LIFKQQKHLKTSQDVCCDINQVWLASWGGCKGPIHSQKMMLLKQQSASYLSSSGFLELSSIQTFPKQIQTGNPFLLQLEKL